MRYEETKIERWGFDTTDQPIALLIALLPVTAMAQDLDDMFDTLTYLLGKTLNIRYSIRNAYYVFPHEKPIYLRWDLYESENQDEHFKYVKTRQIMFVPLLSNFNYSVDTHRRDDGSEFCGVVVRNTSAEEDSFAGMAASMMLSSFYKKNSDDDPTRAAANGAQHVSLSMSWYDCKTAVRIKETSKQLASK